MQTLDFSGPTDPLVRILVFTMPFRRLSLFGECGPFDLFLFIEEFDLLRFLPDFDFFSEGKTLPSLILAVLEFSVCDMKLA